MSDQVRKAIEFARSNASTGGPESIQALHTLAGEVVRLQEALKGAHVIVETSESIKRDL